MQGRETAADRERRFKLFVGAKFCAIVEGDRATDSPPPLSHDAIGRLPASFPGLS